MSHSHAASRRTVLGLVAGSGVALPVLSACGGATDDDSRRAAGGGALGKAKDIPVGGGKVFAAEKVVVTQPQEGEFEAFSAVCTHQGCLVSKVSDDEIDCPCHGSRFSAKDGSVIGGPATQPLPAKKVTVKAGRLLLG